MSGWDDIPTGDQLADASLELEAFRDSVQESQKYSRGRDPHAALVMSKRDEGVRVVDSLVTALKKRPAREFAPGDTLRTVSDRIEHLSQVNPELLGRLQKKPVAPRPAKKPVVYPRGVVFGIDQDIVFGIDRDVVTSVDKDVVTSIDKDVVTGIDQDLVGVASAFAPVPKERWGKSPRSPNGLIDAMSKVSLLELWKDRPIEDVRKAILELEKQDRFSASAIADGAPFFKPDPREVRRIINSEWNIDLSYAGHDFALPGQQKKSPALNATQSLLLEVVTAVATRSAALGRNDESPLDLRSPFGFNRAPGTVLQSLGPFSAAISKGNWALGIHGDRTSFVEALQGIIAPERDTWLNDQFRFAEAILSPSQRDRMGEHRTPLKMSLGPTRTMLAIRQRLAEAPEMTAFVDPEGQIALMGKVDNSDPFWDRAMFTPGWDHRREEILMDAVAKYPHALAFLGDRPVSGSYFDPYTQQVESFRTEWMVSKKDPKKENTLGKVEVDHVVALKYAWDHGFREMYLGAIGDPVRLRRVVALMQEFGLGRGRFQGELQLVNRAANQEKSDKGPDRYMVYPVAKAMREHQANAFYVAMHRKMIQALRAGGAEIEGFNPNFMATSLSERRAMERIDRGWDLGSDTMLGRGLNFGRNAILENFILPDLSEDASYLQTRESLAMMWFTAYFNTATWRYNPKNAIYLLGRPYVSAVTNAAIAAIRGKTYHMPEVFREMLRSDPVQVSGLRNFMYEAKRQGTTVDIFDKSTGVAYSSAKNRISVPSIGQAFRYAMGDPNAFGVAPSEFAKTPEAWRLARHPDFADFFRDYVRQFVASGDVGMLGVGATAKPLVIAPESLRGKIPDQLVYREASGSPWIWDIDDPSAFTLAQPVSRHRNRQSIAQRLMEEHNSALDFFAKPGNQYELRARFPSIGSRLNLSSAREVSFPRIYHGGTPARFNPRHAFSADMILDRGETFIGPHVPSQLLSRVNSALHREAASAFASHFGQIDAAAIGRIQLNAAPFLVDLSRSISRGIDHAANTGSAMAGIRLAGGDMARATLVEGAVKFVDIGVSAAAFGRDIGGAFAGYASNIIPILGVETGYSLLAQASGQQIYASPSMGKTTLLGHDLLRPHKMRFWGGLNRLSDMRGQLARDVSEAEARLAGAVARRDMIQQTLDGPTISRLDDLRISMQKRRSILLTAPSNAEYYEALWQSFTPAYTEASAFAKLDALNGDPTFSRLQWMRNGEANLRKSPPRYRRRWNTREFFGRRNPSPRIDLPSGFSLANYAENLLMGFDDYRPGWTPRIDPALDIYEHHQARLEAAARYETDARSSLAVKESKSRFYRYDWRTNPEGPLSIRDAAWWRQPFNSYDGQILSRPDFGRRASTSGFSLPKSHSIESYSNPSMAFDDVSILPSRFMRDDFLSTPVDHAPRLDALDAGIASNLSYINSLIDQGYEARRDELAARRAVRRARRALSVFNEAPPIISGGLEATGLRRLFMDLQASNPRMTMFAGRVLHSPISLVENTWKTTKFYSGGFREHLKSARAGQFGAAAKGGARVLNVVGHGWNVYGAVESWSRYRSATDLMERSGDRGFGGLSDEERDDVASYAEQSVGDLLVDLGFSMATLDPLATATGGFNAYQRSKVQRQLIAQQGEYRSMAGSAVLRGGASVSATYAYKRQLSVLADMGYIPGVGDSLVQAGNDRRFREIQAAAQASLAQARRKEAAARTDRERSSVKKHLNQILTAGRLMVDMPEAREGGEDVADSLLNPFTGPKSRYAAKTYPMRTSIPFRMSEDPRRAYEADSVNFFGRRGQSDALAFDPVAHSKWQRSSMVAAIGDNNRLLIDSLATGSTPGLRGFSSRTTVRRIGHAIVDQRVQERRDSIMADTRRSLDARRFSADSVSNLSMGLPAGGRPVGAAQGMGIDPTSMRLMVDWFAKKTGLASLRDWERRELEADTLQAAQRRGK